MVGYGNSDDAACKVLAGIAEGGPLMGGRIYHAEPKYYVARDRLTKRILLGSFERPSTDDIEVGFYEHAGGAWRWHSPNSSTK